MIQTIRGSITFCFDVGKHNCWINHKNEGPVWLQHRDQTEPTRKNRQTGPSWTVHVLSTINISVSIITAKNIHSGLFYYLVKIDSFFVISNFLRQKELYSCTIKIPSFIITAKNKYCFGFKEASAWGATQCNRIAKRHWALVSFKSKYWLHVFDEHHGGVCSGVKEHSNVFLTFTGRR